MNESPLVYLDHAATSPIRPPVWKAMSSVVGVADFNPASAHAAGGRAADVLEESRAELARLLGTERTSVVFTGGGTLSDNLAVLGFARARAGDRPRLLVSAIEHKAVLEAARRAESEGTELHVLEVDGAGRVHAEEVEAVLAADAGRPTLVSVMWANNEVGVIQPIARLAEIARRYGALLHTDAVQAFGKVAVSMDEPPIDLLTITAHKLGGPVGIGLLACPRDLELQPLAFGGEQERRLWPGTQNAVGARGFEVAARLAAEEREQASVRWKEMRDGLAAALREAIPDLRIHGEEAERLPSLLSVGVPECDQAALLVALDMAGIAVSAGSACTSGAAAASHVLEAMGIDARPPYAVVRFSFGPDTDEQDVQRAAEATARAVGRLRGGTP